MVHGKSRCVADCFKNEAISWLPKISYCQGSERQYCDGTPGRKACKLVEVLDVTETFIMRGDIDDIKDGLIKEVASVMADMDEIQIRQFIAMMKAAKEVV